MSLKQRITDIATQIAQQMTSQFSTNLVNQTAQQNSGIAEVTKVDGSQLTIKLTTGNTITVTNVGGRNIGIGDSVATDGQFVAF